MADTTLAENNVFLYDKEKFTDIPELKNAAFQIYKVLNEHPKSIVVELNVYRKYCPLVLKHMFKLSALNNDISKAQRRIMDSSFDNKNKRWTKEEDEKLIEAACDPSEGMTHLSVMFGRSPQSIASRLTHLVGVKRLSQDVAGRFTGYINGIKTEADIAGTVHKEAIK